MVKQSGHLFHIDFGKFLGDKQMVGKINRDRSPFVLTPDMIFVINGGNKPSQKFHDFVDLCCKSFNIIRKNGNVLVNFFHIVSILDILFIFYTFLKGKKYIDWSKISKLLSLFCPKCSTVQRA